MSSGYFPLSEGSSHGKKLLEASKLIQDVCDSLYEDVYGDTDGQFDNAMSNGESLAMLKLAKDLIEDEIH